jgi:serine/threonine protein kinase
MKLPDEITSNYKVIKRLGGEEGGNVYLVEDLSDGGLYVIKELILPYYSSSTRVQKIINEISSAGEMLLKFSCKGLPKFFDFIPFDGTYYFLMEYIDGDNLDSLCEKSRGFFPVQKVVSWAIKICNSLSYIHSQDFIFKDLKPEHIIIDKSGEPWLVDFGLSRYAGLNIKSLQISYNVSPYFSSPEHYEKQDITRVSDVYSLGATLYFVLTESFPLDARELIGGEEKLKNPSELNEHITDDLDFIIMKSLKLKQEERYQTAYAFKEDLEKFLAGREIFKGKTLPDISQKKDRENTDVQDISEVATWGREKEGNQKSGKKGLLRPRSNLLERAKYCPLVKSEKSELPVSGKDRGDKETFKSKKIEPPFIDTDRTGADYKEKKTYGKQEEAEKAPFIKNKKVAEEKDRMSGQTDDIPVMSLLDNPDYSDNFNDGEIELQDTERGVISGEDDFKKILRFKSCREDSDNDNQISNDFHKNYSSIISSASDRKKNDADLLSLEERLKEIHVSDDKKEKSGKFLIILCNIIAVLVSLVILYIFLGRNLIAEWHFTRGKELLEGRNVPGSIVEFQHAMEFKEFKNREIYFWIGKAYNFSGNKDDAKRYLNNYLEICPEGDFSGEAKDILKAAGEK